ncbi:Ras-related protein Rab-13 isoform X2 [Oopsacas minuta]|uniref:Ras-related protein Rab-13 isoform X2 n=1 Tax=Oopsacas minuta TaxID=111878 RepID=A0AAV7K163_9METZ|nr:Ras-related protein Rab-13 isoform X2 [Oopsacas minuta]
MSSATPVHADCFNILLLGQADVGKSSIIRRLDQNCFVEGQGTNSLGRDFIAKNFITNSGEVSCRIWDTADMERHSANIPSHLFRGKQGFVFVLSFTCKHSWRNLRDWIDIAKSFYPSGLPPSIILANKNDSQPSEKTVNEVKDMYNGYKCFETSALSGHGLIEAFEFLADEMLRYNSNRHDRDHYNRGRDDAIRGASFSTVDSPFNFVRLMKTCSIL